MNPFRIAFYLLCLTAIGCRLGAENEVIDEGVVDEEPEESPFAFGGALRANYIFGSYDEPGSGPTRGSHGGTFEFDTFRLDLDLAHGPWLGRIEYRWYERWNAPHTAWLGYEFEDASQVQVGLTRTPFGVGPYGASHNWFFNLDYYVGLADNMNVGVKYTRPSEAVTLDFAYYVMPAPHWRGHSNRSARYSYDIVDEGITNGFNRERHQGNVRIVRHLIWGDTTADVGLSGQLGRLENRGPGSDGWTRAGAVHAGLNRRPWGAKAQVVVYDYDVDNAEPGGNGDIVVMGAYDFPYEVASRGVIPSLGVSYVVVPGRFPWIDEITFYNDFSTLLKRGRDLEGERFNDSLQNVTGASVAAGNWFNYFDLAVGRGAPFIGSRGDVFFRGLSANPDNRWNYRFNINLGYYF